MRIVNTTGYAQDTKIYDDEGNDITVTLRAVKIEIEAGDRTRVKITCEDVRAEVVGDQAGKEA